MIENWKSLAWATCLALTSVSYAGDTAKKPATPAPAKSADEGERPATTPGWVIVEEDVWYPLRFVLHDYMDRAREQFRHREQTAAAQEVKKAVALLKLAEGHATPEGVKILSESIESLQNIATDLEQNKVHSARTLDLAVRKSYFALATHHYLKAKSSWGNRESKVAGQHLQTAANYISNALQSAEHEFGKEVIVDIERIAEDGQILSEERRLEPNQLEQDLAVLQRELNSLGKVIQNAAK